MTGKKFLLTAVTALNEVTMPTEPVELTAESADRAMHRAVSAAAEAELVFLDSLYF